MTNVGMTKTSLIRVALVVSLIVISGCSSLYGERGVFRGKGKDYLKTGALPHIKVPADMKSRRLETLYVIPPVDPRDEFGDELVLGKYQVPRPQPINTEKGEVGVKIQKLGERTWIFLNASTSQVWPRTQNFLSQYGLSVASSDPVNGHIVTDSVMFKDDEANQYRFRLSVEKGVHPETTEIHMRQIMFGKNASISKDIDWAVQPQNAERSKALLNELASVLAKNIGNTAASLLGQNVGGAQKVEFLQGLPEPTMRLRLFEERAKASVAHALEKESFILWEEAVNYGLYYVGYNPKADKGFFERISGDNYPEKAPYGLTEILSHLSPDNDVRARFSHVAGAGFGEPLEDALGVLVLIQKQGDAMDIVVRDVHGKKLPVAQSKQILREIRKNLI